MSGVVYLFSSSIRLTAITISLLARLCGAPLTTGLFIGTPAESSRVVFAAGVPHYSEPNLDLDATESVGQFLDGRGFLLAHLRAAEAQKAPFFGGLRDLLRHSDQPLLEPLGLFGFGFLIDERRHLPHALDPITLDLIRRFAFQFSRGAQLPGSRFDASHHSLDELVG